MIVGAPASNAAGRGAGRAYVVSGNDGAVLATLDGQQAGDAFGSIVAGDKKGRETPVLVEPSIHAASGHRRAYVADPDGHWISLGSRMTEPA